MGYVVRSKPGQPSAKGPIDTGSAPATSLSNVQKYCPYFSTPAGGPIWAYFILFPFLYTKDATIPAKRQNYRW